MRERGASFRKVAEAKFFHRPSDLSPIIINASDLPRPAEILVSRPLQCFTVPLNFPLRGRGRETMAKAPPLLPCIMNRVPGFSIFRNFFFPPSLPLPFNTAKDSTNSFRNEKLTSLSVYVKRGGVWFFFFLYIQISHEIFLQRRSRNIT